MQQQITQYYNQLASKYDQDRFGNSYGIYIDSQEQKIVSQWLKNTDKIKNLDIACGTGRFLNYAHYGIDASQNMIATAQDKYPNKQLSVQDAAHTDFKDAQFQHITCFHLLMHLNTEKVTTILSEWHRILEKNGKVIVDVPSKHRRQLINYKATNWHGANDYTIEEIKDLIGTQWTLIDYYGIAFFPIHRIPSRLRKYFIYLDNFLCRTFIKRYASYLTLILKKA